MRLKWLKIIQFFFVWKTSNDTHGRPKLRINPHISANVRLVVDRVAKLVFVSVIVEADDSPAPIL